jgi:photosystem II stability/assembly factor-like uncharacterized protein
LVIVSMAIDPPTRLFFMPAFTTAMSTSRPTAAKPGITPALDQDQAIVYSIAIDPQDTQRGTWRPEDTQERNPAWAGSSINDNGGATWSPSLYDLGADYQDYVSLKSEAPNTIFAATHEHGPVRSQDYGETWKVLTTGTSIRSTRAILVDPRPDYADTVYTGVWTKAGVFKSTDGGGNWELKSDGLTGANIYGLAINPFAPKTLYAATFNMGVMKTTNGANSWFGAGPSQAGVATARVSPADGQTVYAGTAGDGLYLSRDGGQSWNHSQAHLNATSHVLVVSPVQPSSYWASLNGGGVMYTQDSGRSWQEFNDHLNDR